MGYGLKMEGLAFHRSKWVRMLIGEWCGSVHLNNIFFLLSKKLNFLVKLEAKSLSESEMEEEILQKKKGCK